MVRFENSISGVSAYHLEGQDFHFLILIFLALAHMSNPATYKVQSASRGKEMSLLDFFYGAR